jgi:DnaJ-class molecular chaperone
VSNLVMCETCSGSGIGASGDTASSCTNCNGSGGVILRDSRGKFAKYVTPTPEHKVKGVRDEKN